MPVKCKITDEQIAEKLKEVPGPVPEKCVEELFKPKGKPAIINHDFEDAVQEMITSSPSNAGPVHIDLEMDDGADPVGPAVNADPDDYTDHDWFDQPIPRKGTIERAIWDKAYSEIGEIQTLRGIISSALNRGERLPSTEVERYNKYVSKYGEVGA